MRKIICDAKSRGRFARQSMCSALAYAKGQKTDVHFVSKQDFAVIAATTRWDGAKGSQSQHRARPFALGSRRVSSLVSEI
jgi:hypothetical protein